MHSSASADACMHEAQLLHACMKRNCCIASCTEGLRDKLVSNVNRY